MTDYPWEVRPLGSMLLRRPRYGINAPARAFGSGGRPYIRITDIDDEGRFRPSPRVEVSHSDSGSYLLQPGDVVFARTGASVGKSYRYDPADGQLVFAGFLINITPDPTVLNPGYLATYVQTTGYWNWVAATSARSGQPGINGREYALMPLPVPPIEVQNSISEAMKDCNTEISTIERLIAKKQAVRTALLRRLIPAAPTASGHLTLGSLAKFLSGGTPSRSNSGYWSGSIPWISASTLKPVEVSSSDQRVTPQAVAAGSKMAPVGSTLILVRGSALHSEIRASLVVRPVCFNQDVKALVPAVSVVPKFLTYAIHANAERLLRLVTSAGNTAGVLDTGVLKALPICLPSRDGQERIVEILADADDEINCLTLRLEKAKAIKQGIAHQLLAGKTRLPALEAMA